MVWVKLDDRFAENPKILRCSVAARWLHVEAMCFCGRNETGGFVPEAFASLRPEGIRAELVASGLWEPAAGGWSIHDWADFNPSAENLADKRRRDRERKASERNPRGIQADPPRARVPSPSPSPESAPEPEVSGVPQKEPPRASPAETAAPAPTAGSEAEDEIRRFVSVWNGAVTGTEVPALRANRLPGDPRQRSMRAFLRAAEALAGKPKAWEAVAGAARWFAARALRAESGEVYGIETFLRASHRETYLEHGMNGHVAVAGYAKPYPTGYRRTM